MPWPSSTLPVAMVTEPSRSKCTRCVRRRASDSATCVSTGLFMGGFPDRAHHPVVRSAATEVLVQRLANLLFIWVFVGSKERSGADRYAAHAVAALRGLLVEQRLLHRMRLAVGSQALDGGDRSVFQEGNRQIARGHRP